MTRVRGLVAGKRNARQFAAEVGGVALAIFGMMQDGVRVMEDIPLGDGRVCVADAKLFERPVGNVLAAVGAVFVVGVEGEALEAIARTNMEVWDVRHDQRAEGGSRGYVVYADKPVLSFRRGVRKN